MSSRAVITHFDGDPFTINAWLMLYEKYWRTECDAVFATIYYNPKTVSTEVLAYIKILLADYPEIKTEYSDKEILPEIGNQKSLLAAIDKYDYIGMIESDGLIYQSGIVDQCFRLLEDQKQDIVAPAWELIDDPYFNGDLASKGFMRCFFFAKSELLKQTDCDLMPKKIPANTQIVPDYSTIRNIELDCFGWLSWQLLLLTNKITYVPNNILGPDNILSPYNNYKWVHIRQMSSSAVGMGGAEFELWQTRDDNDVLDKIWRFYTEDFPNGPAEFIYLKTVAFKLLFYDLLLSKQSIQEFANDYKYILDSVVDCLALPKEKLYEVKGFYKGLFNI